MYPLLRFNKQQILENTQKIVAGAAGHNISITGITKCSGGNYEIAETILEGGAAALGDSRIQNLKTLQDLDCDKWLIRMPMLTEIEETVRFATLSLNSELKTVAALNEAAERQHKNHDILLMVDLGDLREGYFFEEEFVKDLREILKLKHITVRGIGSNLSCTGAIVPTVETYEKFFDFQQLMKRDFDLDCQITSGGASSTYFMLKDDTIPSCINNLRIGEMILLGTDTSNNLKYDTLHQDNFILDVEIIEIKEKPSMPIGKIGCDAYGNRPVFVDKGIRRRAICALGKQDTTMEDLTPLDKHIEMIASSSDHLILDITDCDQNYHVGDIVSFRCNYASALHASTSEYIRKAAF
ncbi:MAG: alanine/ornithine racemase family PLP-dependent enzyme [Eubacterium sp.]|nr:alanine/ornithine racemase family PLP-dependent enzyme [Eubacterium sp.]